MGFEKIKNTLRFAIASAFGPDFIVSPRNSPEPFQEQIDQELQNIRNSASLRGGGSVTEELIRYHRESAATSQTTPPAPTS